MSGGVLDADKTSTVSGALTQSGNIEIDVADNKTLTYSGAALNLGANTLTLSGGGTLSNTNALVLNHANRPSFPCRNFNNRRCQCNCSGQSR